ncbi:MAG TPA: response regulator [Tepidisphaeraceae bacterium]|jgi:DNA-binding NarL/FixJ family response regulator
MLLVVDDDPAFLQDADRFLDHECGMLMAGDATQAKKLLDKVGDVCAVALIDLNLPDEHGFSLIRQVHQRFPSLRIIAISGVSHSVVFETALRCGATEALRKPITPEWNAALKRARVGGSS